MAIGPEDFFDDQVFEQFPQLAANLSQVSGAMFPAEGLSEQERQEMAQLLARENRLQPLEDPQGIGSTRISGNPFSFDISPVVNAVQSGLTDTINAVRQKRLMGDPEKAQEAEEKAESAGRQADTLSRVQGGTVTLPNGQEIRMPARTEATEERQQELEEREGRQREIAEENQGVTTRLNELQTKQEQATTQTEAQNEMLQKMFPDLAGRLVEMQKQMATEEQEQQNMIERIKKRTGADIQKISARGQQEINQLDKELENWIEQQKFKMENNIPGEGGGGSITSGDINNFRQVTSEMTGVIDSEIAKKNIDLQTAQSRAQSDRLSKEEKQAAIERANQLRSDINSLQTQKENLMNQTFQRAAQQLNMPVSEIKKLFLGDREEESGNEGGGTGQGGQGGQGGAASDSTGTGQPSYNDIVGN